MVALAWMVWRWRRWWTLMRFSHVIVLRVLGMLRMLGVVWIPALYSTLVGMLRMATSLLVILIVVARHGGSVWLLRCLLLRRYETVAISPFRSG